MVNHHLINHHDYKAENDFLFEINMFSDQKIHVHIKCPKGSYNPHSMFYKRNYKRFASSEKKTKAPLQFSMLFLDTLTTPSN